MNFQPNATMKKFGYPATLLRSFDRWSVLLRPQQVTLGSLVVVSHEEARLFADLSQDAFTELKQVISESNIVLNKLFSPDKYNYLMLMMVDPDVHFHLLPRYEKERQFAGRTILDSFWPKPVDLTQTVEIDAELLTELTQSIKSQWA